MIGLGGRLLDELVIGILCCVSQSSGVGTDCVRTIRLALQPFLSRVRRAPAKYRGKIMVHARTSFVYSDT